MVDGLKANGILGVIANADAVQQSVAILLLVMSAATWYLILAKSWQVWRIYRRGMQAIKALSDMPQIAVALEGMQGVAPGDPFHDAAAAAFRIAKDSQPRRAEFSDGSMYAEHILRRIRRGLRQSVAKLESGLAILASVGATAPFVGLFGTVWGIYHALIGIGFTGQATIDKVAGPVGEALVMTAFGLVVAIPAVLAYNFVVRANRRIVSELDAFAHDLHAWIVEGDDNGQARQPTGGG
jgi:biopolymer transport protein ExbB